MSRTKADMLSSIKIMDCSLDYNKDLQSQLELLHPLLDNKQARLTIIDVSGNVWADTGAVSASEMDNHLERQEIKSALSMGSGYARRYSKTLDKEMIYVAFLSDTDSNYIIRVAIPFSGMSQYLNIILPVISLSIGLSLLVSLIFSKRFALSISTPLNEMASEILKVHGDCPEIKFREYRYEELNVISDTMRRMSENIKQYINKIEQEKKIRQEFFSNASHELKTPITSIQGYTELLQNGFDDNPKMRADFLMRIKKEVEHMTHLINDILMISKLESKDYEVIFSDVNVKSVLDEVVETLKPAADEAKIAMILSCPEIMIKANPQQIMELLSNLISNAIKYNKLNGTVWVNIEKSKIKDNNSDSLNCLKYANDKKDFGNGLTVWDLVIVVEDTGVGIPKEAQNRVFERFFRVDQGRSKKMGGTGLGLSIVKHIVNYYNGTIELMSRENEGTRFTVKIPIFC